MFWKARKFILDLTTILQGPFCSVHSDLVPLLRDNHLDKGQAPHLPQTSWSIFSFHRQNHLLRSSRSKHLLSPQKVLCLSRQTKLWEGDTLPPSPSSRMEAGIGKKSGSSRMPDKWLKACKNNALAQKKVKKTQRVLLF